MKCFTTKTSTTQAGLGGEGKYSHMWSDTFLLLKKKKNHWKFHTCRSCFLIHKGKRYLTNIYLPPPEHLNCKHLFYTESSHGFRLNTTRTNSLLISVFGPKETKTPGS